MSNALCFDVSVRSTDTGDDMLPELASAVDAARYAIEVSAYGRTTAPQSSGSNFASAFINLREMMAR